VNPRYKIDCELGKGGTSVVYKATDLMLNRVVALKVLNESLASDKLAVQRLRREAKTLCTLQHPNIVQIFAFEIQEDGVPLMVMDVAKGISLSKILQHNGPLPEADAVRIYKQTCAGLSYAHGLEVVHRDIKPSNIIATANGGIKILDFGVAKFGVDWSEELQAISQSGKLFGTLSYMSPEQLSADVDSRTDVYSLGCTMYQVVTGQLPFRGETPLEIAQNILTQDIPKITTVSPGLEAIILRSMVRDRNSRYQSCEEVLEALNRLEKPEIAPSSPYKTVGVVALIVSIAVIAYSFQQLYLHHEQAAATQRSADWDNYLADLENSKRTLWREHVSKADHLADQAGYSDLRGIRTYMAHTDRLMQHAFTADYEMADILSEKAFKLMEERKRHNLDTPPNLKSRIYKARGDVKSQRSEPEEARKFYELALPEALNDKVGGLAGPIAVSLVEGHLQNADAASAVKVFQTLRGDDQDTANWVAQTAAIRLDYTDPNLPRIGRSMFTLADELDKLGMAPAGHIFRERLAVQNLLLPDEYRLSSNTH